MNNLIDDYIQIKSIPLSLYYTVGIFKNLYSDVYKYSIIDKCMVKIKLEANTFNSLEEIIEYINNIDFKHKFYLYQGIDP